MRQIGPPNASDFNSARSMMHILKGFHVPASSPRILTALPVFNEVRHVRAVLAEVARFAGDILVVDDGSSDGTAEELASIEGVTVVTHPVNFGYGAALKTAFHHTVKHGYDGLVTIDCDGQHQPQLIPAMGQALWGGTDAAGRAVKSADIVSGSRYLEVFDDNTLPPVERRRVNVEITDWLNSQLHLGITDAFCGFKAYRADALRKLRVTEYGYAMPLQLWVQAARQSLAIEEFAVPLIYLDEARSFGGSLDDVNRRRAHYHQVINRELADQGMVCDSIEVPNLANVSCWNDPSPRR